MSPRTRNLFLSCLIMGAAFLLMRHREDTPVPPTRSFTNFPLSLGGWDGTPLTLDQKEKDILKADDYALVNYAPADGGTPLLFYTAYYRHQTAARNIHSPKNCLPGSGWDVLSSRVIDVPLEGPMEKPVRINETVIQKGLDEQVVLYWYQERGRIFDNEYWGRFYLVRDALTLHRTDGALVRLSMPLQGTVEKTVETELRFVQSLTPILARYIPGRKLGPEPGRNRDKNSPEGSAHGTF